MTTFEEIGRLCRTYADARDDLERITEDVRGERRRAVRERMRALKGAVARVSAARDALKDALEGAPHLFEKPRTRAVEGIKVGFRKLPGKIEVADEAKTLKRIRDKLPEKADVLIVTKESVNKKALAQLSVKELASIGAVLGDDDDEVVIKAASTDLDKLVDALLADGEEGAE